MAENKDIQKTKWRRFVDGIYTRKEVSDLSRSLRDQDNLEAFDEVASDVWKDASYMSFDESNKDKYRKEARSLLRHIEHAKRMWFYRIVSGVASVAAIFAIVMLGINYYEGSFNSTPNIAYVTAATSFGEKKIVHLPDGSTVMLNSCSILRYPKEFKGDIRQIELNGEAFFSVVHHKDFPFVVTTKRMQVKVLGTKFNVKSYSTDQIISMSVESGKVQVDLPEAMMRLTAHQELVINTINGDYSKRSEMFNSGSWRKGSLHFDCTPIHDVIQELERVYGCHIILMGSNFNNLISGDHDNRTLQSVLNSIHFVTGGSIKYKRVGKDIILYK